MSSESNQDTHWSPWNKSMNTRQLKLFNSFTRKKETFTPIDGKRVFWYNCGPTVYDSSHMGHARSYISFDIIRRILTNYFKYNVFYVINITDIDDKIIKRARQEFIYQKYKDQNHTLDLLSKDLDEAIKYYQSAMDKETDNDKLSMMQKIMENLVKPEAGDSGIELDDFFLANKNVLVEWLDSVNGATVTDNSIFESLPRKFELEYFDDMAALNIMLPDAITRVSEYVPEIITYIERIIENGFAYVANESVYFDTVKFDADSKHRYGKLVPEAIGDAKSMIEGEGVLSVGEDRLQEKRNSNDFALWKKSKPGEPRWTSKWGDGRPGWHIECSLMASEIFGEHIDIHSGGYDLKFPHHDNEIAQSEAYINSGENWVNYFLHSGHLTISGCKMSKSLKNFITIKDALKRHSARQLRLAFLLHSWKDTLDYGDSTMTEAINYEKFVNEFFLACQDLIRSTANINLGQKWTENEKTLNAQLLDTVDQVDEALCDNIDAKRALDSIRTLVSSCNIYLNKCKEPNAILLRKIALWITEIFKIFGLIADDQQQLGFAIGDNQANLNREEVIMPLLDLLCKFREEIRLFGKDLKLTELLVKCDQLRDDHLPELGIKIEDKEIDGKVKTIKKLLDKETILNERLQKLELEKRKHMEKEKRLQEQQKGKALKEAQSRINPVDMFKNDDSYSAFDENGLPTLDKDGQPLSKSKIKNLTKLHQQQQKLYQKYLATLNN